METAASKGQHGLATELNEAQCKEIAFNERKLQLAKVEAALAGHLSPDEIGDDLIHAVDGHVKALAANQKLLRACEAASSSLEQATLAAVTQATGVRSSVPYP